MSTENDFSSLYLFKYKDCISENPDFCGAAGNLLRCFASDTILKDTFIRGPKHCLVETEECLGGNFLSISL